MARYNANRYQYETSPRKLQPEYRPRKKEYPKKSTVRKNTNKVNSNTKVRIQSKNNIKIILYIGFVFAILFAVSYRNALITQEYSEIKNLKSELSEIEKDNKQIEVNIESKINLSAMQEKAETELGLKKLDDKQTVYVSLNKQDYIESSEEEVKLEQDNWFENIVKKLKNIF